MEKVYHPGLFIGLEVVYGESAAKPYTKLYDAEDYGHITVYHLTEQAALKFYEESKQILKECAEKLTLLGWPDIEEAVFDYNG